MHKRAEIRDYVVSKLQSATSAGSNVFGNRFAPLWENETPSILVYSLDESSVDLNMSQKILRRTLHLGIEIRHEGTEQLDDVIDDISDEVEILMKDDQDLGGNVIKSDLVSTEFDMSMDAEVPIAALRLNYEIVYLY